MKKYYVYYFAPWNELLVTSYILDIEKLRPSKNSLVLLGEL